MKNFIKVFSFVLLFTLIFSLNTFASTTKLEDLPPITPPYALGNHLAHVVYELNGIVYYAVGYVGQDVTNRTLKLQYDSSGTIIANVTLPSGSTSSIYRNVFQLVDGEWVNDSSAYKQISSGQSFLSIPVDNLVYSSVTIYDKDDNAVFPEPPQLLHQVPVEIMKAEAPGLVTKVVQAMKVLTTIAVGLMALLIGLVVFSKVFRIFLR